MKKWTILMYLNGNNELGIEMERTFLDLLRCTISPHIDILIEIGKAPIDLVNSIRNAHFVYQENWTGVRRYLLNSEGLELKEKYDQKNMADYQSLTDFIEWGMTYFPANRYAFVMSGHGFIAAVADDFCNHKLYTLGIYEFCYSLNQVKKDLNRKIDLLILDCCNTNNIEILYELRNSVNYVLTYKDNGPLGGLVYSRLVGYFNSNPIEQIFRKIIKSSEEDLIPIKINDTQLERIKSLSNLYAYHYLLNQQFRIKLFKTENEWGEIAKNIQSLITDLDLRKNDSVLLHFIFLQGYRIQDIASFLVFYQKMSFIQNHYGMNLLARIPLSVTPSYYENIPVQGILSRTSLIVILKNTNPLKNIDELNQIADELYSKYEWQ